MACKCGRSRVLTERSALCQVLNMTIYEDSEPEDLAAKVREDPHAPALDSDRGQRIGSVSGAPQTSTPSLTPHISIQVGKLHSMLPGQIKALAQLIERCVPPAPPCRTTQR